MLRDIQFLISPWPASPAAICKTDSRTRLWVSDITDNKQIEGIALVCPQAIAFRLVQGWTFPLNECRAKLESVAKIRSE